MSKTKLIIFINEEKIGNLTISEECKNYFDIPQNNNYKNDNITDFDIWIVKDISDFAYINDKKKFQTIAGIEYNSESTYIVLHNSVQGKDLQDWRKEYPEAQIDTHPHEDEKGNFYKEILPKICDGKLTLNNLEEFFQTDLEEALNDLHSSWNKTDINDKETLDKALETLADERTKLLTPLI